MARIKTKFITANAVTNPKLAQMAAHTYKGNNTGSTADAADITNTQLTADLNLFSSSLQGLAPASGGGTANFLRADGNWASVTATLADFTINAQTGTTYTFALTDRVSQSTWVTSSNSSNQTLTVPLNSSVAFPIGSQINITQLGTGATLFAAAAGVTLNSAAGVLSISAQYQTVYLLKTGTDTWELFGSLGTPIVASGGNSITTNGNFKVHTFTSSGTFQITSGSGNVSSVVIAGGGGGGRGNGGGGGAGGMLVTNNQFLTAGSYTVTIGAGGAGGTSGTRVGGSGSNSVFGSLTATGGGGGGSTANAGSNAAGAAGGSGGGSAWNSVDGTLIAGGTGTGGQGSNGGSNGGFNASGFPSGGGGGAGGAGAAPADVSHGGSGGLGLATSISGSSVTYASGGGGGLSTGLTGGTVSAGGGGAGGSGVAGTAGTANTGGGGGGSGGGNDGGAGGSGIVIVTYQFQ